MKTIDFYQNRSNIIQVVNLAVEYLNKGGIIIYPTDTIYGFGCNAANSRAIKEIKLLKNINQKRPFSVIMRDLDMVKKYCFLNSRQVKVFKKLLPGKFTLIVKCKKSKLSDEIISKDSTIGVRIPDYDLTAKISKKFKFPYVSTSVNETGKQPMLWGIEIIEKYKDAVLAPDLIIDGGKLGEKSISSSEGLKTAKTGSVKDMASTVIDLTGQGYKVLRNGALDTNEVLDLLSLINNQD
ncbi:MAG: threonylcarbamoyl-AMP synthase [Candidatus Moranbacteria bacterium]|nr:threonylcarbamoyl-AMP synthase [Candidatus Moranbacteria bacterium]